VGIDSADADRVLRIVFGRASLSDAGDMQLERGAAVPLDVTLSALDDGGRLAHILLGPSGVTRQLAQNADEFVKVTQAVGDKQERDTGQSPGRRGRRAPAASAASSTATGGE
jgi:hypothetical protein